MPHQSNTKVQKYRIQNIPFLLELNEKVFSPSIGGLFFAQHMHIRPNETVLDIGTGSGVLAVLAAKFGGKVWATDTSKDAIELTQKNADKNHTSITVRQGKYFADFHQKFDVIVANLPQEIVHNNYKKLLGKQLVRSIDGGPRGNKQVLEFLDVAKSHIFPHSRVYMAVYTLSDYTSTFKEIMKHYNATLIAFDITPVKTFVTENIDWYKKLNEQGKIAITKREGKWFAYQYMFELTLKV